MFEKLETNFLNRNANEEKENFLLKRLKQTSFTQLVIEIKKF